MIRLRVSAGKPKEISRWRNIVEFCMGTHLQFVHSDRCKVLSDKEIGF